MTDKTLLWESARERYPLADMVAMGHQRKTSFEVGRALDEIDRLRVELQNALQPLNWSHHAALDAWREVAIALANELAGADEVFQTSEAVQAYNHVRNGRISKALELLA